MTTVNADQQLHDRTVAQIVAIMTTEHSALQSARAATISETGGRSSLFVGTVSSGLVALALIAQASHLGPAFDVFGFVLFLALFLLGLFTFQRAVQSGMEDLLYARGINRIRHFYVEVAPQLRDYFVLSTHDDAQGVLLDMGVETPSWWQSLRSTAGMVAMVNSVLGAVCAGLLVSVLVARSLALATGVSLAVFVLSLVVHQRAQLAAYDRANRHQHALFPSTPPQP